MATASKSKAKAKSASGTDGTPKKARASKAARAKAEAAAKKAAEDAEWAEEERIEAEVSPTFSQPWMQRFIEFLGEGGHVSGACRAARVGRSTAYRHRQADEAFAVAWADAEQESTERLEEEAYRRAHDGLTRNKYDKDGNLLCEELVYSDTLMIFLLKARDPEKYRDRLDLRHSGKVGKPQRVDLSILSDEDLAEYERITEQLEKAVTEGKA